MSTCYRISLSALIPILIAACFSLSHAPAAKAQMSAGPVTNEVPLSPARSLGEMLDADGTLRPEPGFRGSLDVSGWQMTTAPDGAPVFRVAPSPDDDNWQPGFYGIDGSVAAAVVDEEGNLYIGGGFTVAHNSREPDRDVGRYELVRPRQRHE